MKKLYIQAILCGLFMLNPLFLHGMFVNTARTVGRQTRSAGRAAIMRQAQQQQQAQQRTYGSGGQAAEGTSWWSRFWHGTAPTMQSSEIPREQRNYSTRDTNAYKQKLNNQYSNTGESNSYGSSGRSHRFVKHVFMSPAVRAEYEKLLKALGLEPDASIDEMKKEFKKVSLENHPDIALGFVKTERMSEEAAQRRMAYYGGVLSAYTAYENALRAERKEATSE